MLLLKRVRLIAERNAATPAERLLDDLLRLLDASESAYDANEVQEVQRTHAGSEPIPQSSRYIQSRDIVKLPLLTCKQVSSTVLYIFSTGDILQAGERAWRCQCAGACARVF